jgi:hypothetical protein
VYSSELTFRRNVFPPLSEQKNHPNKQSARSRYSGDSTCECPLLHKRAVGPGGGRVSSGNTINELDLTTNFL